ncbi:MAG: heterokaryon incompatibility protein [Mycoplasmataceae bacterium RV_VA103A]|nr:MAG: heterokaryon incompatibility protein [Mycoplasmataceae bacterium RV_VA103A]
MRIGKQTKKIINMLTREEKKQETNVILTIPTWLSAEAKREIKIKETYEYENRKINYREVYLKCGGRPFSLSDKNKSLFLLPSKLIDCRKISKTTLPKDIRAEEIKININFDSIKNHAYAILSYVCGKKSSGEENLTLGGKKSLVKAIEACRFLDIDYLWMDQLCIDQDDWRERGEEIRKLHQYYRNAKVTLIAIQTELGEKKNDLFYVFKRILSSKWLTRSWTIQEGLLSKQTIFMFDDCLVDGRTMAKLWVSYQQPCADEDKFSSSINFEKDYGNSKKIVTPLGWTYYERHCEEKNTVSLSLNEALSLIRERRKNLFVDDLHSIFGLLTYGDKIKIRYKGKSHRYTKKEFNEILFEIIKVSIWEKSEKIFNWSLSLCWTSNLENNKKIQWVKQVMNFVKLEDEDELEICKLFNGEFDAHIDLKNYQEQPPKNKLSPVCISLGNYHW